jgi:hypothetical protein
VVEGVVSKTLEATVTAAKHELIVLAADLDRIRCLTDQNLACRKPPGFNPCG